MRSNSFLSVQWDAVIINAESNFQNFFQLVESGDCELKRSDYCRPVIEPWNYGPLTQPHFTRTPYSPSFPLIWETYLPNNIKLPNSNLYNSKYVAEKEISNPTLPITPMQLFSPSFYIFFQNNLETFFELVFSTFPIILEDL